MARDRALVERARAGGPDARPAFTELVEAHQSWLVRHLLYLLGGHAVAEDVAQEALVRAFVSLSSLEDGAKFKPWLRQIASRLAFNRRRDENTRREYETRSVEGRKREDSGKKAERRAIETNLVHQGLTKLSYPYREILVLYYVEELPIREISESLEIGMSAAKMRLSRARSDLKAALVDLEK